MVHDGIYIMMLADLLKSGLDYSIILKKKSKLYITEENLHTEDLIGLNLGIY